MTDETEWDTLARSAQQGDKKAYYRLLQSIAPYIRNVISPSLANKDWADDITQDILMGVHKSLPRYIADQPFKPWLNAIIRYRRAEFFSRYYHQQNHMSVSIDETNEVIEKMEDPIANLHDKQVIDAALSILPTQQQTVFRLLRLEGYSVKEVSQQTGMSESAVKVSAHRSAQKLKTFIEKQNK